MLLISVLVVSIFTLFFAASISYKQIKSLNESAEEILQSYKVNLELGHLKSFAKEAESNQRGYLLTKDTTFLKSYRVAIDRAKNSIEDLRDLTSDIQQSKT